MKNAGMSRPLRACRTTVGRRRNGSPALGRRHCDVHISTGLSKIGRWLSTAFTACDVGVVRPVAHHLLFGAGRWSSTRTMSSYTSQRATGPRDGTRESCAHIETDNADVEPAEVEAQMRRMVQLAGEEALSKAVTGFHDAEGFQASTLGIGDRANREAGSQILRSGSARRAPSTIAVRCSAVKRPACPNSPATRSTVVAPRLPLMYRNRRGVLSRHTISMQKRGRGPAMASVTWRIPN